MKNSQQHSKRKIVVTVILLTMMMLSFSIWYYIPVKSHTLLEVFSSSGSKITISADLSISRSFFSPLAIKGQIIFGDTTFKAWVLSESANVNFFEQIQKKIKGKVNPSIFVNESNFGKSTDILLSDLLFIHSIQFDKSYCIQGITFILTSDGSSIWSGSK